VNSNEVAKEEEAQVVMRPVNIEAELVRCCLKLRKLAWAGIPNVADMLAGLMDTRSGVVVKVVDSLSEEVVRSLENITYRDPQKQLACFRLLGELFGFNVIDAPTLFNILFLILYHGHHVPPAQLMPKPTFASPALEIEALNANASESVKREQSRARFVALLKECHANQAEVDVLNTKAGDHIIFYALAFGLSTPLITNQVPHKAHPQK
jgi:hypothetical protein